jgi:hypothetical protein
MDIILKEELDKIEQTADDDPNLVQRKFQKDQKL